MEMFGTLTMKADPVSLKGKLKSAEMEVPFFSSSEIAYKAQSASRADPGGRHPGSDNKDQNTL